MISELSKPEFELTFGTGMRDVTQMDIDNPVEIWSYVEELVREKEIDRYVLDNELVERVYRNEANTFDQVLLPTDMENVFMVIVIDIKNQSIHGHRKLNLNEEYR